jgi:hypothetical protein
MTFDIGFGNAWPAITSWSPVALDTTVALLSVVPLSVTVLDEDGDPTTYEWYENGGLVQSGPAANYDFNADLDGAVDQVLVVATDGSLADSLEWTIRTQTPTGVSADVGAGVTLSASPTPFDRSVTVRWALGREGNARVSVYDLGGRRVAVLFEGRQDGSTMNQTWNGRDESGRDLASGVYFARLEADGVVETRKLVLLR